MPLICIKIFHCNFLLCILTTNPWSPDNRADVNTPVPRRGEHVLMCFFFLSPWWTGTKRTSCPSCSVVSSTLCAPSCTRWVGCLFNSKAIMTSLWPLLQEFSRFHVEITPMLDRLLNNRKEWNALKEVHEAKLAALEEAKKAKEEKAAATRQGWPLSTFLSKQGPSHRSSLFSFSSLPTFCSKRCPVRVKDLCPLLDATLAAGCYMILFQRYILKKVNFPLALFFFSWCRISNNYIPGKLDAALNQVSSICLKDALMPKNREKLNFWNEANIYSIVVYSVSVFVVNTLNTYKWIQTTYQLKLIVEKDRNVSSGYTNK